MRRAAPGPVLLLAVVVLVAPLPFLVTGIVIAALVALALSGIDSDIKS